MTRTNTARHLANDVEGMTDRLSQKQPAWWLAFFNLVLLAGLVLVLWWNATNLQTTIKQNTEALTRAASIMERMERVMVSR